MKRHTEPFLTLLIAAIVTFLIVPIEGCKKDAPSLFDPSSLPMPVVDSLSPAGGALAGIDTITIYGENFSPNPANDGVFFNSTLVNNTGIFSASATKLAVKAPAISGSSISVRVYVIGAVDFSPTYIYALNPAISAFGTLASGEGGYGTCAGPDTNLYVSLSNSTLAVKDEGIFKITSAGAVVTPPYVSPTTLPINTSWLAVKFFGTSVGAGTIYAVKGTRAAYKLAPGTPNPGGTAWAAFPSGSLNDLDFDPDHNLWMGGNGIKTGTDTTDIAMATLAGVTQTFHFTGSVRAVRYYNGDLYFAASTGSASQIWRASVTGGTFGTPEVYFDASSAYSGAIPIIWGIAFSADGDMYVGLDAPDYLIIVHHGGGVDKPYQLYVSSGVLTAPCKSFAWIGTTLYSTTSSGTLLKIATGKQSAPYYGIQ